MLTPLMTGSLVMLPSNISFLALGGLIVAGLMEFRQGHIGRVGIALNAFLLWQIFFSSWGVLPDWFQLYLNAGTIFAAIALVTYTLHFRLPSIFYSISFIGYGSLSLIAAIVIAITVGVPVL